MTSLITRVDPVDRVRVPPLDVAHSVRRTAVVVGPVAIPSLDELRDRFTALAALGPLTRLCLEPSAHTDRWRRTAVDAEAAISVTAPLPAGADPTELIPRVRALRGFDDAGDGVRILCAGDYLAVDFSHGLGEVSLVHTMLDVLFGLADPRDPAFLRPYRHALPPLPSAVLRTFGTRPRRAVALFADYRRPPAPQPTRPGPAVFAPSPATCAVGLPSAFVEELRGRRDATLPGVGLMALCSYALWQGFAVAGLAVDNVVKIPFDVRRYLRDGHDTLAPFSAGLDFALDSEAGPQALQTALDRSARTGRPVANLLLSTLKLLRGQPDPIQRVPVHPYVRLLHSNIGRSTRTDGWPFTDPAAARVLVASDPAGPEGVTITSAWSLGNLWLTAEFHRDVFDPALVGTAMSIVGARLHDLTKDRLG